MVLKKMGVRKIGQDKIIKLLEKEKRPMSRSQIAKSLKTDSCKVSHILNVLLKQGVIKCSELDRKMALYFLKTKNLKRRTRVYYI